MTSTPAVVRPRRFGVTVFVALLVVVVDQATKAVIEATMPGKPPIQVIGEWLQITFVLNPGAAFGLGTGMTVLFSAIAIGVVVVILRVAQRLRSVGWAIALGGILGGAIGNLLDRIFRSPGPLRGHVVDWIEVPHWPVFNIADSAIVLSAVLMVVLSLRGIGLDGVRAGASVGPAAGGASGSS
jgi:signal peptidase II